MLDSGSVAAVVVVVVAGSKELDWSVCARPTPPIINKESYKSEDL